MEYPTGVKPVQVTDKDWLQVERYVKGELDKRKTDKFRKIHEAVWKEVDRQVYMEPMKVVRQDAEKNDWHNVIELGELAKASELITEDAMRLAFPDSRAWFEPHVELQPKLDPQTGGNTATSQKEQVFMDGALRALMAQQHLDFGLKSRVSLSIKEALHHGSYVIEVRNESAMMSHGDGGISSISAPVWVPHSMWNSYPDLSPSIMGSGLFYQGSMILIEYMPKWKLEDTANKGIESGWMPAQIKKVKKRTNTNKDSETEDVELIKYFGDCVIRKKGESDIYLPNSKIILANDTLVYYAPNDLPFPNIIYGGYEKLDVRDPYYTSPLIKLSPMHKVASVLTNQYLNSVALRVEPPILYDGNDPAFVANGGPQLIPGWKGATKGKAEWKALEVGDPKFALQGLQLTLDQIRSGTSSDSARAYPDKTDKTATEIKAGQMRGEVRVVGFVTKLEYTLKVFLHMQHEINKKYMDQYSFYNPEMDAPDFMRVAKEELPQNVRFDVVGSRGILGEDERSQKVSVVTAFASQNPLFAPLLKPIEILLEQYRDAGVKNPERWLNVPNDELETIKQQIDKQYQQHIQELQQQVMELEKQLAITKAVNDAKVTEASIHASIKGELAQLMAGVQAQMESIHAGLKIQEHNAKMENAKST